MKTYREILRRYEAYALEKGREPSAIKRLLMHFSALSGSEIFTHIDDTMDPMAFKAFESAVKDYIDHHRPIQHITGNETFYGYDFLINKDALIPRFETEELVENTLGLMDEHFADDAEVDLLDLGTGSGCIAIVMDKEDARVKAIGTDISEKAVVLARRNAEALGSTATFVSGDMFEPVKGRTFDIILSNPPYIPNDEDLDPLIRENEPHEALFGGKDGLDFYRKILSEIKPYLNPHYIVGFEHAYHHADAIKALAEEALKDARIIQKKDMQGKDRMTFIVSKR
ncbi:MAG: peptide chain release factor N(5)-glutamine methyltransferase [Bacillota bacterium]